LEDQKFKQSKFVLWPSYCSVLVSLTSNNSILLCS